MFSSILLTTLFAALAAVRADPNPSEPGPNEVFNEGQTCHIAWDPDTTGLWKTMYIELMTGNNFQMVHLTTVATVDGTDPTNATYDWPCPQVTPNSDIYFYQFTSPDSPTTLWTTRYTIADQNGNSTPPENTTQPDGKPIPWGVGRFVDPSQASPPPPQGSTGSTAVIPPATGSNTVGGASATSAPASAPSNSSVGTAPSNAPGLGASPPVAAHSSAPSGIKTSSPASGGLISSTGSSNAAAPTNVSASGAVSALNMGSRATQAVGTLVVVALAYAVAL